MKIRLATIFSGIGAVEFALKRLNIDHELIFACDNGERDVEYDVEKQKEELLKQDSIEKKHDFVENLYKSLTKKKN